MKLQAPHTQCHRQRLPAKPFSTARTGPHRPLPSSGCKQLGAPSRHFERSFRCQALDGRAQQSISSAVNAALASLHQQQQQQAPAEQQQQQQQPQQPTPSVPEAAPSPTPGTSTSTTSPPGSASAPATAEQRAWEAWCEWFEATDEAAAEQAQLQPRLQRAIASERYGDARHLQERLNELEAADAVAGVRRELQAALEREDYDEAARLRDEGWAALAGWWCGQGEDDDPRGHLMHISAEHGRWTGKVYTPRDLAEHKGWADDAQPFRIGRGGAAAAAASAAAAALSAGERGSEPSSLQALGTPVLELFVRKDADGGLSSRAVALRPALGEGGAGINIGGLLLDGGAAERVLEADLADNVLKLSVSVDQDGMTSITASATMPLPLLGHETEDDSLEEGSVVRSVFAGWEQEEARATLLALRSDVSDAAGADAAAADHAAVDAALEVVVGPAAAGLLDQAMEGAEAGQDAERAAAAAAASSSTSEAAGQESGAGLSQALWRQPQRGYAPSTSSTPSSSASPPAGGSARMLSLSGGRTGGFSRWGDMDDDELVVELQRSPADVTMRGRDAFVLTLPEDTPQASSSAAESGNGGAWGRSIEIEVPLSASPLASISSVDSAGAPDAAGPSPADDSAGGSLPESANSSRAGDEFETWQRVAEAVAKYQEARGGRALPKAELTELIQGVAKHLISHGVVPDSARLLKVTELGADGSVAVDVGAGATVQSPLTGRVNYSRIQMPQSKTDPFTGLYLGAFGPHGPELLQLSRGVWDDGEECVVGVKLTGDANVPAGAVSFRAKIGRRHRLEARENYPEDLCVVARYKGEGRVAQPGFKNARFVEGELLHFSSAGSPLTGGAQLGFVWAVPNERRFLILLNRIELE